MRVEITLLFIICACESIAEGIKKIKTLLKVMLIFVMFFAPVVASAQNTAYVHDEEFPFIIITKSDATQAPALSDEEFYRNSAGVIFRVNRTEIPSDDRFMKVYRDSVLPKINGSHLQLRKVFIRGAASPEGPYAFNQKLGCGRSKALLEELQRDLLHQYVEIETDISCITEDYGYLCRLMKEANDPDYALVQDLYDQCQGDEECCKKKLVKAKNGSLWSRLLRQYFPRLRAARLILWFTEPDAEHAPIVEPQQQPEPEPEPVPEPEPDVEPEPVAEEPEVVVPQSKVRRHMLAVRTNLLHDFFYMPQYGFAPNWNVQFEFYPWGGHMTYNLDMTWGTHRHWGKHRFFQIRDFQFEARRYFRGGGRFLGFYLGAVAEFNVFGIGLNKERGWQGEGGAASISAGYVAPLTRNKRLRMEFMLAAGYYLAFHDPYVYGNPITGKENGKYYYNYLGKASDFKKRNHTTKYIGPTNVGIQLTYDLAYRKRDKVKKRIDEGKLKKENCF